MSAYNYQIQRLKITTLTPLHIGSGNKLLHEYDYAIYKGFTWRINENNLLDAQSVDDPKVAAMLARTKPAQLLKAADFTPENKFFRYVMKGTPNSEAEGAVLVEQIKDTFDRPYLPGTTLKGALRTALGWHLWKQRGLRPDLGQLNSMPKFAAGKYEDTLFGDTPNKDLLRALQVEDSASLDPKVLMLANIKVTTHAPKQGRKQGAPIEVEAVRKSVIFETKIKLDLQLFSDWAKQRGLSLVGEDLLLNFAAIVRDYNVEVIRREVEWARKLPEGKNVLAHYQEMQGFPLAPNQFFLQLGWGGGWEQKTFGSRLKQNPEFMRGILKARRDGGFDVGRGHVPHNIADFPISRRIAMGYLRNVQGEITREVPALPLGWVLVEVGN